MRSSVQPRLEALQGNRMASAAVHSVYYNAAVAVVAGRLHNVTCRQAPPYLPQEHVKNRDHERVAQLALAGACASCALQVQAAH